VLLCRCVVTWVVLDDDCELYVPVRTSQSALGFTSILPCCSLCCVQSLMAFYIWGNEATIQGIACILLVIFGSGLYTWVQMIAPAPVPKK
jgi:hypothetical protein